MINFNDLGLAAPLLKALEDEGYTTPTPIQAKAIPPLLEGRDLLGIAQTGTGKTAAFALPILQRLAADPKPAPRRGCRVLVLSPTRELASQIALSFETYGRHMRPRVATVFGGVGYRPQREALARGLDILVATPGRLLDLIGERTADLHQTEVLVLDEADQMLDLGFIKPIRQIVAGLAGKRQNLLFSATMPREISGLADSMLVDPIKVAVTPVASTVERVTQRVIHIEAKRKRALLAELLADPSLTRALVFTRTKRGADRVADHLETHGITVASIHGNKSQRQREIALDDFKTGRIRVLVATDIAARGIDVDQVSHVVNFELPEVPEAYVHRIGRTGRAGASGMAISLCDNEERDLLRAIERTTRQTIPSEDRRGDVALTADEGARRQGSGRSGDGRRHQGRSSEGRGSERPRHEGRRAEGGRRQDGSGQRDSGRQSGREAARDDGHRDAPRQAGSGGQRSHGRPSVRSEQQNSGERREGQRQRSPRDGNGSRDAGTTSGGDAGAGLAGVRFMSAPTRNGGQEARPSRPSGYQGGKPRRGGPPRQRRETTSA